MEFTAPTYQLPDGTLCNPLRRVKKHLPTLIHYLSQVLDGRSNQGKRHQLEKILAITLIGMLAGCKNIQDCYEWCLVKKHWKLLTQGINLKSGLPHPTTISRALGVCEPSSLMSVVNMWRRMVFGVVNDAAAAMDGKTLNGVHNVIGRHILSLTTHQAHTLLGQETVSGKENEITASHRLLEQAADDIYNLVITGDAILTQKKVVKSILSKEADYLLAVKKNNKDLYQVIKAGFQDKLLKYQEHHSSSYTHGREANIMVKITQDFDMRELRREWMGVQWIIQVTRSGKRPIEVMGTGRTKLKPFLETHYFICSKPELTPIKAAQLIRGHWSIENNLHWQKDHTYLEDRQTLKHGNAPSIMSYLRGLAIELLYKHGYNRISQTVRQFSWNTKQHQTFLRLAHII